MASTSRRSYRRFLAETDSAIPELDARLDVFISEYLRYREAMTRPLRILDVGCGPKAVLSRYLVEGDIYCGCDFRPTLDVDVDRYVEIDLNEESLAETFLDEKFDVVFCGEVIEHLFSPDSLVAEVRALMHDETILILSTPNLAYYVNRILLLAGIAPLFLENSSEAKLGRKFRLLGQGNETQGHIRVFTYGAVKDLMMRNGFQVVKIVPTVVWNFPLDKVVCRFSRSLAPNNVFIVRRG